MAVGRCRPPAHARFDSSVARDVRRFKCAFARAEEDVPVSQAIEELIGHTEARLARLPRGGCGQGRRRQADER